MGCSEIPPEKFCRIVVAQLRFRKGDVHMEYMANPFVAFRAVAAPLGFHAFFRQECMHGLGTVPEKVMAGGGDEGRGVLVRDVFQHPEPGIIGRQFLTKLAGNFYFFHNSSDNTLKFGKTADRSHIKRRTLAVHVMEPSGNGDHGSIVGGELEFR